MNEKAGFQNYGGFVLAVEGSTLYFRKEQFIRKDKLRVRCRIVCFTKADGMCYNIFCNSGGINKEEHKMFDFKTVIKKLGLGEMKRVLLIECGDREEQKLGICEAKETIRRIVYYHSVKESMLEYLRDRMPSQISD